MRKLILCLLLLAPMAWAQQATIPDYKSVYINDYADLLSEPAEEELTGYLKALRSETGVEMTVLTIEKRSNYGQYSSIKSLALRTFNSWGIGEADKNNGILFLIASEDREMRIELGSGYAQQATQVAEEIIDSTILPHFADQEYERGIMRGSEEIERRIARGQPAGSGSSVPGGIFLALISAAMAFFIGKKVISNRRERRCPACKSEDITKTEDSATGRGRACLTCGHSYFLPMVAVHNDRSDHSGGNGGGFGGGGSSGGGASGGW